MHIDNRKTVRCGQCGSTDILAPVQKSETAAGQLIFKCGSCSHEKREVVMSDRTVPEEYYQRVNKPNEITF